MGEDELDEALRELIEDYHRPVETPREAMWRAIERRRAGTGRGGALGRLRRWVPLAAAALVLLAVGVTIGRLSDGAPAPVAIRPPASTAPEANPTAYQLATLEHLSQAEEFLTLFRSSVGGGEQRLASSTARRLLGTNRMLLDSPAAMDRRTRLLLEDLELVLAGIAQLPVHARRQDMDLIREGMESGQVMPRLRTVVPSGAAPSQGAL
ncbi:MAG TPA: hypothetical protein VFT84_06180 [Gemmatimonadales bacterium]|nr:hypothetical protein [Gemmatimonadales bacterium]